MKTLLKITVIVTFLAVNGYSDNLITNGDFSSGTAGWNAYRTYLSDTGLTPKTWVGSSGNQDGVLTIEGAFDSDGAGLEQTFDIGTSEEYVLSFKYGYTNVGSYSSVTINWRDASDNPVGSTWFQFSFDWTTVPDNNPNDVVYNNSSWLDAHITRGAAFHFTRADGTSGNTTTIPTAARKAYIRVRQHYAGYRTFFDDIRFEEIASKVNLDYITTEPFNNTVRGQNVKTSGSSDIEYWYNTRTLETSSGSSMRGVAGGLEADTYNWKDRTGRDVGNGTAGYPGRPTLEFLREARDYNNELLITVNVRGTGTGLGINWTQTNTDPNHLAQLAADWVRYTNHIVQNYRQGDTLPAQDAAIVNALQWDTFTGNPADPNYDRLLAPGEQAVSKVTYWEIGNEPKAPITGYLPIISVSDYVRNYKIIANAMKAVDPDIKVGPCFTNPVWEEEYYDALLSDPCAVVDFLSYHPYNNVVYENETISWLEDWLQNSLVEGQVYNKNLNSNKLIEHGRSGDLPLITSEWNTGKISTTLGNPGGSYMVHALACAENVLTFGEIGLAAAMYWSWPIDWTDNHESSIPVAKMFKGMEMYMGDRLAGTYVTDGNEVRVYAMLDSENNRAVIWGLNLSDSNDVTVTFDVQNLDLPFGVDVIQKYTLRDHADTGFFAINDVNEHWNVGWQLMDLSAMSQSALAVTFENASVTAVVLESNLPTSCDDPDAVYLKQDINQDCQVDFKDIALMVSSWLECTDPAKAECDQYWWQ